MASGDAETQLIRALRGVLSTDEGTRSASENLLAQLASQRGYAAALAQALASPDCTSPEIQQMAGSALRSFVSTHWSQSSAHFQPPLIDGDERAHVRSVLLQALPAPNRKASTAVSLCIAKIAEFDWPHEWPDLTPSLAQGVWQSDDELLRSGCMRCLSMMSEELEEPQLSELCPNLLPTLSGIVSSWSSPSVSRDQTAGALSIIRNLMQQVGLCAGASTERTASARAVEENLPHIAADISSIISSGLSKAGLEISYHALTVVLSMFHYQSKHVAKYATGLMNACWTLFQSSLQPYVNQFVYEAEEEIYENNTSLATVVIEIAEVLALLLGIKRYRRQMKAALPQLVDACILYSQATAADKLQLEEEPSVAAGLEDSSESWDVRDVFSYVLRELAEHGHIDEVLQGVRRQMLHLASSQSERWWQRREASLFICSSVSDVMLENHESLPHDLRPDSFAQSLLSFDLSHQDIPDLLKVRALSLLAGFGDQLSFELANQILDITCSAIETTYTSDAVRLVAIKAAAAHVASVSKWDTNANAPCRVARDLTNLLLKSRNEGNDRSLMLDEAATGTTVEALSVTFKRCSEASKQAAREIAPTLLSIWEQNFNDPLLGPSCNEALKNLCNDSASAAHVHELAIPPLLKLLDSPDQQPLGLPEAALDLVESLITRCGDEIAGRTCSTAFPGILKVAQNTSDAGTIESACMVMRAMVRTCGEWLSQVVENAVPQLLHLAAYILRTQHSPTVASEAATLLAQLVRRMPQGTLPHLHDLLLVVCERMVNESNVLIAAAIVPVLARIALLDANGFASALIQQGDKAQRTLEAWLNAQNDVQGSANIRMSTVALARIAVCDNNQLRKLTVRKLLTVDSSAESGGSGIRTRSKTTQQSRMMDVPFEVRALELVADALVEQVEGEADVADRDDDAEDYEADSGSEGGSLDRLRDSDLFGNEEDGDDDVADDPYSSVDVKAAVAKELQVLTGSGNGEHAMMLQQYMDASKLAVLQAALEQRQR